VCGAPAAPCGYGVLILSWGFWLHIWMGILISATMIAGALTALTLLPALVLALRPKFIFGGAARSTGLPRATSIAVLAVMAGITGHAHAETPNAAVVMENSVAVSKVSGSTSTATVELFTAKNEKRTRVTTVTTKLQANGSDYNRVVRFSSPADVRGTGTLLIEHTSSDDDIWIYLPALKKVRRIASSNKSDRFVGTDFSYADVIGHKTADWSHTLLADENVGGQDCYVVESTPKSADVKSASGYSKRKSWIRKDNFVAIKAEAWDPDGKLLKRMTYSQVEVVDAKHGKYQPMVLEATNVQNEHRTTIKITNFKLEPDVADSVFTTAALERE
jgi:outer membrane lipoprotein-sorting protein